MTRRTLPLADFRAACAAQGVPREHMAFMCPVCGTVQSIASLMAAGASQAAADKYIGFSCEGRLTNAGPAVQGRPAPGRPAPRRRG
ncbi:MAG: hypothetical protein RL490_113, partial [Pseudomonadota bacterium]